MARIFRTTDGLEMKAAEVWQALVGAQTPEEFVRISRERDGADLSVYEVAANYCAEADVRDNATMLGVSDAVAAEALATYIEEECGADAAVAGTFEVVRYGPAGSTGPDEGAVVATGTLAECRDKIGDLVWDDGHGFLLPDMRWSGVEGDIEAYHEGTREGCGGWSIRRKAATIQRAED